MLVINCDGACSGNPGPGGWGVWAENKEKGMNCEFYGHSPDTTNNQMELSAAIIGASLIIGNESAKIRTDSNYVIKGMNEWISGWKKKGWKTSTGSPVKNESLWRELDGLCQKKNIEWEWVKGHSGDFGNEKADSLANVGLSGEDNYSDFVKLRDSLMAGGTHVVGSRKEKSNSLSDGREIFVFSKEVSMYPNKKGYLLVNSQGKEIVFTQEDYDKLK